MPLYDHTPQKSLEGAIDYDAVFARMPETHVLKGMFFSRLVKAAGDAWEPVKAELVAPPRFGRFVPFADYPLVDYVRITQAAAATRYPELSPREGARRLARDDLVEFGESTIGGVMLSLVRDPLGVLMKFPDAYRRVLDGSTVQAERVKDDVVRLEWREHYGISEYMFGQIEGAVMHYGATPRIRGDHPTPDFMWFEVSWSSG